MVIVDPTLPDIDGLDLLENIRHSLMFPRLMIVTSRRDERTVEALKNPFVHGIFETTSDKLSELPIAINIVKMGRTWKGAAEPTNSRAGSIPLKHMLTEKEMYMFALLGGGEADMKVAHKAGVAKATVQWYRQRLLRKLELTSSADLIFEAVRRGVVRITPDRIIRPGFDVRVVKVNASKPGVCLQNQRLSQSRTAAIRSNAKKITASIS